jgi:glycosyltransferase involved in cell wall biosynthesis
MNSTHPQLATPLTLLNVEASFMITIIIPCYNYARFLPDALESALAQAGPDLEVEVLVVDDGSIDDTPGVAARYGDRIRYHRQENAGLSAARNTGMALATHNLVLFLDADDMLTPGALARLVETRGRLDPPPAVLASRDLPVDREGCPLSERRPETSGTTRLIPARDLVLRNRFPTTVLADRRILVSLGGFDTELMASEDRDLWVRVAASHSVALLDHITLMIRKHGNNMSLAGARQTAAIERVLEKAFSNPDLALSAMDRCRARAICHHQSALMFADAGDNLSALLRILRSFGAWPFGIPDEDSVPGASRLRCLASLIRKNIFQGGFPPTVR